MAQDPGPMVRRRQLGTALRRYRLDAHLTIKDVADRLLCSESKVSRIETAQRNATLRDVRDLSEIYGLDAEIRESLMDLARGSRLKGWWQDAGLDAALETMIGMEGSATTISEFEALLMPGLLQTREYADAILTVWPAVDRRRAVDIRMRRQEILNTDPSPHLRVVLDEAAVRRVVGSHGIMHDQLTRLIEAVDAGIDIRIIPFDSGVHLGMTNGFTILEFPTAAALGEEPALSAVVYTETLVNGTYLDTPEVVRRHLDAFSVLHRQALPLDRSADLLRTAIRQLGQTSLADRASGAR